MNIKEAVAAAKDYVVDLYGSEKIEAEEIEKFGVEKALQGLGGILVPGGFGERGIEGKIRVAQYAREKKIPYLGLCLGMQIATIEFARHVLKLEKAHSTEFDPTTPDPVIALLDEQKKVSNKGGTMLPVAPRRRLERRAPACRGSRLERGGCANLHTLGGCSGRGRFALVAFLDPPEECCLATVGT